MADILETIAEHNRQLVAAAKENISSLQMADLGIEAADIRFNEGREFLFEKNLAKEGVSFILECKKASPSKGLIAPEFPYLQIAKEYEEAGADAISVLTEPKWFMGSIDYLKDISSAVKTPCLRKDFIVDEYMIYEASMAGASAVLLIASILDSKTFGKYKELADSLGLSVLAEAHNQDEVDMCIGAGARVIGVNNRNLRDFTVDPSNCLRLRERVGTSALFVAESGISSHGDIMVLAQNKVDAVLIGESVMRSSDKKAFISNLRYGQ
ncbi:MAG: indole-3-glycerol phosphate synthase TrpC [Saccharofermentans sp.]|nr:indole-3-glycerol phosphate synthase TrpC [Saccharofermentans sp.]